MKVFLMFGKGQNDLINKEGIINLKLIMDQSFYCFPWVKLWKKYV